MSGKYKVIKYRGGVLCLVREYENRGPAQKYLDHWNQALLIERGFPLCRAFLLMHDGKLIRGPSEVMGKPV